MTTKTVTITFEDAWNVLFRKDGAPRTPVAAGVFRKAIGEALYAEIEAYGRERLARTIQGCS